MIQSLRQIIIPASRGIFICTRCIKALNFCTLSDVQTTLLWLRLSQYNIGAAGGGRKWMREDPMILPIRGYCKIKDENIQGKEKETYKKKRMRENERESEENTLYIEFPEIGTTHEDIKALSTDIKYFRLRRKASGQSYAYITFHTDQEMEEHFRKWREWGYSVSYTRQRKLNYEKETAYKTLRLHTKDPNIAKEDFYNMSKDIVHLSLNYNPFVSCVAFLEFGSKKQALENIKVFKDAGMIVDYIGAVQNLNGKENDQTNPEDIKGLKKNLSPVKKDNS